MEYAILLYVRAKYRHLNKPTNCARNSDVEPRCPLCDNVVWLVSEKQRKNGEMMSTIHRAIQPLTAMTQPFPSPLPLSSPLSFLPSPSFLSPFSYFLLPCRPFPSFLLLELGPLNAARSLAERCQLTQRGVVQSPSRNRIRCILALKCDIWWRQFQWFSWESIPNFVQFKQYQGKSRPRRTTRYFVRSKIFQFSLLWRV